MIVTALDPPSERTIDFGTSRLNLSLNMEVNDFFEMRTLKECRTEEVFYHSHERRLLKDAAKNAVSAQKREARRRHTGQQPRGEETGPFLFLNHEDARRVRNFAKSKLSEISALAHLAADLDAPIREAKYCFALTYEAFGDGAPYERKLRLLLVRRELLQVFRNMVEPNLRPGMQDDAKEYYYERFRILQQMHKLWPRVNPDNEENKDQMMIGGDVYMAQAMPSMR